MECRIDIRVPFSFIEKVFKGDVSVSSEVKKSLRGPCSENF